jgi:hypothetical protein
MALKKFCARSGCNAICDAGHKYCDKHKQSDEKQTRNAIKSMTRALDISETRNSLSFIIAKYGKP